MQILADVNQYQNENSNDELLFKIIALFKREFLSYGCLECYINLFIHNSLPAKKGLVELNDKEINVLANRIGICLAAAKINKYFAIRCVKEAANVNHH